MEQFEMWMWAIWLTLFLLMLIIEALGTDLVSIWFAVGSLVALILSLIPGVSWWVELIVFVSVSLLALCSLRPLIHKRLRKEIQSSNVDSIVGQKGVLTSKIDLLHHGEVRIHDVTWTAIASREVESIEKGSIVTVLAVVGNKLIVQKDKDGLKSNKENN